jgi:hypothetical protein
MPKTKKPIRLTAHAIGYSVRRGFLPAEVEEAIQSADSWDVADMNRLECRWNFSYQREWNGHWYATKQVRPVFVEEKDEIVVITVYTYFF